MKRERSWRPWRWIVRPDPKEELDEELRFHMEQRTRDYVERGMSPESAREAAARRFGDAAPVRDACVPVIAAGRASEARRTLWRISWLDVKLGLRMFIKYPGLSLVSVIGMSVAIAIGAGYFTVLGTWLDSSLPLPEGERIVSIRKIGGGGMDNASGAEFLQWREELKTIRDLGTFRDQRRNLAADGRIDVVEVAAMTASGFRVARIAPVMGRVLTDEDEKPGAPPVVVIGADEWQRRFGSDPRILERTLRLDDTVYAIVGVMPQGFGFPINHKYWVPLYVSLDIGSDRLFVFGRLADGFSMKEARAEVAAVGDRMAAALPKGRSERRARVIGYTHAFIGIQGPEMELAMRAFQFGLSVLLLIVAINVAVLVYARTATRLGEIAVRTALGASRSRVVSQLFVEALVPSVAAAVIGLAIAKVGIGKILDAVGNEGDGASRLLVLMDFSLTPAVILYVTGLALLAAVIAGVIPALKATGSRVQRGLQYFGTRAAGAQLGPMWTAMIVLQVAVAVALLPPALYNGAQIFRQAAKRPAVGANGLVRASIGFSREGRAEGVEGRLPELTSALAQRLEADPEIAAVTFTDSFPGEEGFASFEVEDAATATAAVSTAKGPIVPARTSEVAVNLFDVFEIPVIAGRGFSPADARPQPTVVIVDDTFVQKVGGNVLGRRIRYSASYEGDVTNSPWYEIVGVVPAFSTDFTPSGPGAPSPAPRVFHPGRPGAMRVSTMVVRLSGSPSPQLTPKLRQIAATVHPALRLETVQGVVETWNNGQKFMRLLATAIIIVMSSVLLLSAAGIYAMMSFTVARRRREIGIRAALGADTRRILAGIFRRALTQLAAGVALGLTVAATLDWLGDGAVTGGNTLLLVPGVIAVMTVVGLAAAAVPARRGLAVQPVEALREE
jgi:putative ABC transport system permease protein